MTFALGIRVNEGLVALADTRIVHGHQVSQRQKLSILQQTAGFAFVMTSGLRSIRDKVMVRLEPEITDRPRRRLHELVSAYGDELKRVRDEDRASLLSSGLSFDSHAVIGGQLSDDLVPELFHVYPEGNWVMATADSPRFAIGRSAYSKQIIDQLLRFDTPLPHAATIALLAFDAARRNATDVGYPFDLLVARCDDQRATIERYDETATAPAIRCWDGRLHETLVQMPSWLLRNRAAT